MNSSERNWIAVVAAVFAGFTFILSMIGIQAAKNESSAAPASGAASVQNLPVQLKEFSITPTMIMAKPGHLVLDVSNTGTTDHDVSIAELGKTGPRVSAGGKATVDLGEVAAGNYTVICTVPGHADAGMKAMLMVSGSETAATADGTSTTAPVDWASMDAAMTKVAKSFPAKTAGHGGDPLAPVVLPDGTKQFDLTAKVVDWEVAPGKIVKAWTYNGVVPAPEIKVAVGDKVEIVLHNQLPESTVIHFHGIRVPNSMDGVDPFTQDAVKPGETFTYKFTALEPAVGIYHSHHDAQVQVPNGLFGAFIVGDMPIPPQVGKVNVVKTVNMVLNDAGTIGLSLNGKSFPATEPYTLKVGESMVVNYLNEGLMAHPMHLHQPVGWVIAKDGNPLAEPYKADTVNVAPGERYTMLYTATDPGVWAWHCHILTHAETAEGMTGMVTALIVT